MYASRTQAAKRQRSASPRTTYARQPSCAVSSWYTRSPQSVFTEAARSSDDRYRVQPPLAYFSLLFHSTSMYARPQAAKRQRPASPRTNSARQPSCAASSSSGQEERKESTNRDSLCIMCSDSVTSKYHPHLVTASMCRICVLDLWTMKQLVCGQRWSCTTQSHSIRGLRRCARVCWKWSLWKDPLLRICSKALSMCSRNSMI